MNNEEDDQLQPPRPLPPTLTSDAGSSEVAVWLKWHRNVSRHPLLALYERHARRRADGKVGRLEQPDDVPVLGAAANVSSRARASPTHAYDPRRPSLVRAAAQPLRLAEPSPHQRRALRGVRVAGSRASPLLR